MPQIRVYLAEDNQVTHDINDETMTIGRLSDNSIQIEDGSVSSHHAEIASVSNGYRLTDKGSTNGTFVNGTQITEVVLKDGDQIRFGSVETVFVADVPASVAQPLPQSERAAAALGSASVRPATFVNASPFPKPAEKPDAVTYAAIGLAALSAVAFVASVVLVLTLQVPA
jgi:pSer/pThr/pTyr-binding forkhead associated (FHA) protein